MTTISATDTEVQLPVNVIYQQMLLRNARPLAPYYLGTQPGELQRQGGSATVKWRRFNTSIDNSSGIAPTTTALSELTTTASYMQGRTASTVHFTDVTATVSKYGQYFVLNEEVQIYNPGNTMGGIVRSLAISAGRSLNQLQRDVAEDNSTTRYAGNVASDGAVLAAVTVGDLDRVTDELSTNAAEVFTPLSDGSVNIGTTPLLPGYWAICHPNVAYNVAKLTGFKSVETYAAHVDIVPGEFGAYGGAGETIRFVKTPDASIDTGSGGATTSLDIKGATNANLYTIVIYGQGAYGSVGFGQSHGDGIYRAGDERPAIEMIVKGLGSSGAGDPFDEISTIAWKSFHAGAALNANFSRAIRVAATDLTN